MTTRGSSKDLTVIFLIDALGWEIARRTGFCRSLLPCAGPLDTVLGYSSAAIPSLLSGTPPAVHGAWAMYKYGPQSSPFKYLRWLPPLPHPIEWRLRVLVRWITEKRKSIAGYYDLYDIPLDVLGYFDVAHHGDPYAPGGLKEESFFDRLVRGGIPYRAWNYRTPEPRNLSELDDAVDSPAEVLFFYTAELDELMHRVGTSHEDVTRKLGEYERRAGRVLERAARAGRKTAFFLFSDHGMTDVSSVVDLKREVKKWGYRTGRDFLAFYDSTMARFWCDPALRADLAKRLGETGWGRVLSAEELDARGCGFADGSYGELIFLVHPGLLIVPSYMGREPVAAMHGYDPADPGSRGCFFSNVPELGLPGSILDLKSLLLSHLEAR
jgi:hypothetical protein